MGDERFEVPKRRTINEKGKKKTEETGKGGNRKRKWNEESRGMRKWGT